MLEVKDLNAYYGKSHILRGVNLKIENGEIVSLLDEMALVDLQHVKQLWEKSNQLDL